jgi:hypothetical protein
MEFKINTTQLAGPCSVVIHRCCVRLNDGNVWRGYRLSFPKIPAGVDSHDRAESSHGCGR